MKIANELRRFLIANEIEVFSPPTSKEKISFPEIQDALESCNIYIPLNSKKYKESQDDRERKFEWDTIYTRIDNKSEIVVVGVHLEDVKPPKDLSQLEFLDFKNVGSAPLQNIQWMEELLQRIKENSEKESERLSIEELDEIVNFASDRILNGEKNVDLLKKPLLPRIPDPMINEGIVFLKPEGTYNDKCIREVLTILISEGINIVQVRKYTGSYIKSKKIFDQHYFGPLNSAMVRPMFSEKEKNKLRKYYFNEWEHTEIMSTDVSENLILPALALLDPPYNLNPSDITELWDKGREESLFWNEKSDGLNKIGYQKSVFPVKDDRIDNGEIRLILNGYVPGYKNLLEEPEEEIRVVCFRISTLRDWDKLRDEVFGGNSNPKKCKEHTLRRLAHDNPKRFGLSENHVINGQQNLLHSSATGLEGIREICLWFEVDLLETSLGLRLAHRLGPEHLPDLFFRFHEIFTGARYKGIMSILEEVLSEVPSPSQLEDNDIGFQVFKKNAIERFKELFKEEFQLSLLPPSISRQLSREDAIDKVIEIGEWIRKFGYKAMVEKFINWFETKFFQDKCRQFSNLLVYMNRRLLTDEPEIIGLSIFVLCSDLLILSNSQYPDQFVSDFFLDLHERAKAIAFRTRANALKKCRPALTIEHEGKTLDSVYELKRMKEGNSHRLEVNIGKGIPDIVAIIASGGRSTRVQSIIPKPVLKLHGKYLIMHVIDSLREAFGNKVSIFISLGWESELIKSCIGYNYRFLSMPSPEESYKKHLALGPGARIYAALNQLELYNGPVISCYSDMPLVTSNSLESLYKEFESKRNTLCFLTSDAAYLPGNVIRDEKKQVMRIAHNRYEIVADNPEKDVGYYVFRNSIRLREIFGKIKNDNLKKEFSTHHLVEALVQNGESVGTYEIDREECYTVNNARDLFWLAMGLNNGHIKLSNAEKINAEKKYFDLYKKDYGVAFDEDWFSKNRAMIGDYFHPKNKFDRQVPIHFLNEYL